MPRAGKICAKPGCPERAVYRGHCRVHARQRDAMEKKTVATKVLERRPGEAQRRARAVSVHRARFGDWCPGYGVPPHDAADLTAQHVHAVGYGGSADQQLAVLCRACNSRHAKALRDNLENVFDTRVGGTPRPAKTPGRG